MPKKLETFCLFCGSQFGDFNELPQDLENFSFQLSEQGYSIIFGAGQKGLMGQIYKGAKHSQKSNLTGIPFFSFLHEIKSLKKFTKLFLAKSLGRRKDLFAKKSDVFVVFPGALGTFDEFFHVAVLNAYEMMDKPIILVNVDGYFNLLEKLLFEPVQHNFITPERYKNFYIVPSVKDILPCYLNRLKKFNILERYNNKKGS
ncbi:MAG: TIGR00730 family Rossman fold protein [Clostridia bacterium]|nr:TIGR00730 family Rossman fold protein [Clostridia bacterium]